MNCTSIWLLCLVTGTMIRTLQNIGKTKVLSKSINTTKSELLLRYTSTTQQPHSCHTATTQLPYNCHDVHSSTGGSTQYPDAEYKNNSNVFQSLGQSSVYRLHNKHTYTPLRCSLRHYSTPQKSNSFLGKFFENLKEDENKKKMDKNVAKFKQDMADFNQTETVINARKKYNKLESETAEGSQKARQQLKILKEKVSKSMEDAQNIELVQKAGRLTDSAKDKVQQVGQNISQKGEEISKTQAFQAMSDTARAVKEEIDATTLSGGGSRVYRAPKELRMRVQVNEDAEKRIMEANTHDTGVILHKDSRLHQSWQDFKDNNPYVNRVVEWKTKLDESDHIVVRASFMVKEKAMELFGPMFSKTDLSETLTEICKVDPNFDTDRFLLAIEYDIIPNVLEAMTRPDLEILQDWMYERAFGPLAAEIKSVVILGHKRVCKILDVDNVELMMGKVLEEGPVLVFTFMAQVVDYTVNGKGEVVEGNPEQVIRRNFAWVVVRDQSDFDSRTAWKIMESRYDDAPQFI